MDCRLSQEDAAAEQIASVSYWCTLIQGGEMKTRVWLRFAALVIAAFALIQCAAPATPAPPPAPVIQTVVVPQTVVNTVKETVAVPVPQTVAVPQTVVAA